MSKSYTKEFFFNDKKYTYYDILSKNGDNVKLLPFSIRILLECAIRNFDEVQVTSSHIDSILNWEESQKKIVEIPFKPARVLLQDFTGIPAIVDFAAMRDCMAELGGDAKMINPVCPADLVIDHSVQVDYAGDHEALKKNEEMEFNRNRERFSFLKWGAENLNNMLIVPPGSGIVHQVNLEYLARVVFGTNNGTNILYPDSVVGTDSHTTMINGLGVLGWGVGGIEAEAVMLDQPVNLVLPKVVGVHLTGRLKSGVTSTDLVLTVTNKLRSLGVVGQFVEFFGTGMSELSIADRATVANMCPEYGATCGYFPLDERSLEYLKQTGRDENTVNIIREYLKRNCLFWSEDCLLPKYSRTVEIDLASIQSCVAGPKRPQDFILLGKLKSEFKDGLSAQISFKGFGISPEEIDKKVIVSIDKGNGAVDKVELKHGSVVLAAITSCTNTSNPSVMLGAGLLARNALANGLQVNHALVKTSLAPGSGVVTRYLERSGLKNSLDALGFHTVGYGCTTCIGNSGPLQSQNLVDAINDNGLVVASVLSGNRNFEGRVHPTTRANYLASPPLVVAFAIAGTVCIDFEHDPLGTNSTTGKPVYLADIWPSADEIRKLEEKVITPDMFQEVYSCLENKGSNGSNVGSEQWRQLTVTKADRYSWDPDSTYIARPAFLAPNVVSRNINIKFDITKPMITDARMLLYLGDSITTDHISPAGSIARNSPAARYLAARGVRARDFNSYGSRRGNDEVMSRGTFANTRLRNKLVPNVTASAGCPQTRYFPTDELMDIWECAQRYKQENIPVVIVAGKEYGSGSSRDWAAKGPHLLGVKVVIAESYERIHRSNLIGMGILPLQFIESAMPSPPLIGEEKFSIHLPTSLDDNKSITLHQQQFMITTDAGHKFPVLCRLDTELETEYYCHGGILPYMIRKLLR